MFFSYFNTFWVASVKIFTFSCTVLKLKFVESGLDFSKIIFFSYELDDKLDKLADLIVQSQEILTSLNGLDENNIDSMQELLAQVSIVINTNPEFACLGASLTTAALSADSVTQAALQSEFNLTQGLFNLNQVLNTDTALVLNKPVVQDVSFDLSKNFQPCNNTNQLCYLYGVPVVFFLISLVCNN
jgi:hypothetical protein